MGELTNFFFFFFFIFLLFFALSLWWENSPTFFFFFHFSPLFLFQDPYCKFTLGKKLKKRTRTVKKGGTNPFFNEEEVEFWIGKKDWVKKCFEP